jgi:hypothetical protein
VALWAAALDGACNTLITQLIFHHAVIVFLWAINELGLLGEAASSAPVVEDITEEDDIGDISNKSLNLDTEHGATKMTAMVTTEQDSA